MTGRNNMRFSRYLLLYPSLVILWVFPPAARGDGLRNLPAEGMPLRITSPGDPVNTPDVVRSRFNGTNGGINYVQMLENKEQPGDISLVLLLHGRSGNGNDNTRQLTTPALKPLLNFVRSHAVKTVLLIPQCPDGRDWVRKENGVSPVSTVAELVREKIRAFDVPPERVYVTGISMGGSGVYTLLARENSLFSRAVLVSAGGRLSDAGKIKGDIAIFHGESDRIIPVERARAMAEALRRDSRATVRLSVLPAKGHTDTASAVYTDTLWRWLFR